MWKKLRYSRLIISFRNLIPNKLVNFLLHFPKALIANIIWGFPSKKLKVIGITGTKGKTSTAHLIHHILTKENKKVLLISSIAAKLGDSKIDTGLHVTNPNPFFLQKLLARAKREKMDYVILEVTSHGLAQYRNWGIRFEVGIITQVTEDHITYHGGKEAYRQAKAMLITASKRIVLNQDDPSLNFFTDFARKHFVPVVMYQGNREDFISQNQAAALKTAELLGISKDKAQQALKSFSGIPGRMEFVQRKPFTVVIDFAHTPQSLEKALKYLRKDMEKESRLIAVFGCAGDRDPGRRRMGAVAVKHTDAFIITAEDPRAEKVETISQEIADYALEAGAQEVTNSKFQEYVDNKKDLVVFTKIDDRQTAITQAVLLTRRGDVIGLFGKGHEQSMCFGTTERPWSELKAAKLALRKRKTK